MPVGEAILRCVRTLTAAGDSEIGGEVLAARDASVEMQSRGSEAGPVELSELERAAWRRLFALVHQAENASRELRPIAEALRQRGRAEAVLAELSARDLLDGFARTQEWCRARGHDLMRRADEELNEEVAAVLREAARALLETNQDEEGTVGIGLGSSIRLLHEENAELAFGAVDVTWLRKQGRRLRFKTRMLRAIPLAASVVVGLGVFTLGAEVLLAPLGLGLVLPIVAALWALQKWQVEPRLEGLLLSIGADSYIAPPTASSLWNSKS